MYVNKFVSVWTALYQLSVDKQHCKLTLVFFLETAHNWSTRLNDSKKHSSQIIIGFVIVVVVLQCDIINVDDLAVILNLLYR